MNIARLFFALMLTATSLSPAFTFDDRLPAMPEIETSMMQPRVANIIAAARTAVYDSPRSAEAWGRLGALLDAHKLYNGAQGCYREAYHLAPNNFRYVYLLAIVSDLMGRPVSETAPLLEAAAKIEPDYPPVHLQVGDMFARQGKLPEALASYRKALALDVEFAGAHRSLGQLLLLRGDAEAAVRHLRRAAG